MFTKELKKIAVPGTVLRVIETFYHTCYLTDRGKWLEDGELIFVHDTSEIFFSDVYNTNCVDVTYMHNNSVHKLKWIDSEERGAQSPKLYLWAFPTQLEHQ